MNDKKILLFLLDYLDQKDDFVFLWNGLIDSDNYCSYVFTSPIDCIYCFDKREVIETLSNIEKYLQDGYYLAGFISYEAGLYFEHVTDDIRTSNVPLLWFGVYKQPIIYDHRDNKLLNPPNPLFQRGNNPLISFNKGDDSISPFSKVGKGDFKTSDCQISNISNNVGKSVYIQDVESVREAIARGETYQVNYTFKHKFDYDGDAESLFFNLCMKQSASYSAFIRCQNNDILSLSPELFFRRTTDHIFVKPMKGTIKRGIDNHDDVCIAEELHDSVKNRAENVMIVDLLRNDLGRISKIGSVKVNKLFEIEKYETLFQMTSTVQSELRDNVKWLEFFKSMFPCGSVTGAPKISTMKIINKLEKEPRGVYTGSIGYIAPDNTSVFSVAIRTAILDRSAKNGEMGIGSGIIYDSDAESEYDECLLKANFLTSKYIDFQLIETMLWREDEFYLLELHLRRLEESAKYFQFDYNKDWTIQALQSETEKFNNGVEYRVRLLLNKNGETKISSSELNKTDSEKKWAIFSKSRIDPNNRFLYHKTTNRELYDSEYQKARAEGYYDVLFMNNKGEVTEGAISNIFIKNGNKFYTPPIICGLLDGTFRRYMFESGFSLEEKVLLESDILEADKVYLANSVRGMVEVGLEP
jgi:para-aminobenzoate synthetase / 4-amino-4-deoxychorismate lyase